MRYGFYLPTRGPTATRDGILKLAREGERLGLHSCMIADHIVFPVESESPYPYTLDGKHPELGPASDRAARYITRGAEEMAAAGVIEVDPKLFGWSLWAAIHGIVMLHQSGMLSHGPDYKALYSFLGLTMMKGAGAKFGPATKEQEEMMAANAGKEGKQ